MLLGIIALHCIAGILCQKHGRINYSNMISILGEGRSGGNFTIFDGFGKKLQGNRSGFR